MLLDGDHPELPVPFTPGVGTVVMLDSMTGQGTATGTISPAVGGNMDDDLFRFTVTNADFVTVLASTAGLGSTLNSAVNVYDSTGVLVASGTNNGPLTSTAPALAPDGWAGFLAQPGEYYVQVTGQSNSTGDYELRIDAITSDIGTTIPTTDIDPMMPDPMRLLTPTSGEFWVTGSVTQLEGEDVFFVDVPNDPIFDSVASISVMADSTMLDTRMEVYDATGALVTGNSDSGYLTCSFVAFKVTPGERLYVRMRSDDLLSTNQSMGDWTMRFDLAAAQLSTPIDPVTRRGSDSGHAITPDIMNMPPDPLVGPTDSDLYVFQAQGTGETFVTLVDGPPPEGGFGIHLYDDQGNLIAFDDDFVGTTPQVEVQMEGGRLYYLVVESFEPPPTPLPPPFGAPAPYRLFIEAHHTVDETVPVDDHENAPANGTPFNEALRQFDRATPIQWNAPRTVLDPYGNPAFDHSIVVDGLATGRLQNQDDSDVFSFIPPMDMLGSYGGNNDDAGTAVYFGGRFANADPDSLYVTNSAALATFDAGDWWFVGSQGTPMSPMGFVDNPDTAATDGPEVYTLFSWNPTGNNSIAPILIVGGDFTLITPTFTETNLAAWALNPLSGLFEWFDIGSADAPVRAITEYDPESFDPDGNGPMGMVPDPGGPSLVLGGDFANISPANSPAMLPFSHIALFTPVQPPALIVNPFAFVHQEISGGWSSAGMGTSGPVFAFAVFDPADPGDERAADPMMGLSAVADTPDPPLTLFVGGSFATASGVTVNNFARWDGTAWHAVDIGTPALTGGTNGAVRSITVWDPPDPDGGGMTTFGDPVLVVGGDFTMANGAAASHVFAYGRKANPDDGDPASDPAAEPFQPRLLYETLGTGTNNSVLTIVTTPHFDPTGTENGQDVIVGGAFTMAGGAPAAHIAVFDDTAGWSQPFGVGFDDTVRSLAVVTDQQEPGLADDQLALYAGGDFTGHAARIALIFVPTPFGAIETLNTGVDDTVFTVAAFDDGNPNLWDRNDRPSSKVVITVSPSPGAFENAFIRVYDSNLNLIYTNDTKAPPFPDPAGSVDPAMFPGADDQLVLDQLWAGETYYLVVSNPQFPDPAPFRNTGRYDVAITVDGIPPDLNADGVPDDTIANYFEEPDALDWTGAQRINVQAAPGDQGEGDGSNESPAGVGTQFGAGPFTPAQGNHGRLFTFPRIPTPAIGSTPTLFFTSDATDFGNIDSIDDTDLYYFRSGADGYVEIRLNTTNIQQVYFQRIWDLAQITSEETRVPDMGTHSINSKLESTIRVFDNDLVEIGSSSFNPAVGGENDTTTTGRFGERTYFNRDGNLVIPVQSNRVYFVQVESTQLPIFQADPGLVDWRFATGAYELLINGVPDFTPDNSDDVANTPTRASPIPIGQDPNDPTTYARGGVNGVIRDVANNPDEPRDDRDLYFYYASGNGQVNLTASAVNSTVSLSITVLNDQGGMVASGLAVPGGSITVNWVAERGQRFFIRADGAGGTQGAYRLDIVGVPFIDDHANVGHWIDAAPLTVNTFLGTAVGTGSIEATGDTDLFTFTSDQWTLASVTVESSTPNTLNPFVRVYEIQLDNAGNQYFAQIAFNDNDPAAPAGSVNSRATFSVSPGRPYFFLVEGVDPNLDFGNYQITVRVDPTDDYPNRQYFPLSTALNPTTDASGFATASISGNIEIEEDDDLFRYIAPAAGTASITLNRTAGAFDPIVHVLNSAGVDVAGSPVGDTSTPGQVTFSFNVVRSETYYIDVDVDVGGGTGSYTLSLQTPANDDHPNATEWSLATVIPISSTTGIGTATGIINPSVDTDLFRFNARAVGDAVISVTTPGSSLNPRIEVFDAAFNLVSGSNPVDTVDSAGLTVNATAVNQVFYVLVRSDTVGGGAQTGTYAISVTQTIGGGGGGGGGGGPDDHANAGNFGNASPIPLDPRTGDGSLSGIINFAGDTDLFSFTTPVLAPGAGDRPVYIQVNTPGGGLVDGTLRVYRQNSMNPGQFDLVAADNNGFPGATAAVTINAPGNTTYYVLVEPVGANTGSYAVRVDAEPTIHYLYYPEGYTANTIDEFVPIVNPNSFPVTFTAIARYEVGERDQVLVQDVVIPPNSRGGFTITRRDDTNSLTRRDTPYALEIQSNGQLGATFSHYDFGVTTGEAFTNRISSTWTFSEVNRDGIADPAALGNLFNDYVLFYNPNNADVNVTVTMTYDDGSVTTFTRTVGALRRSGINFDTDSAVTRNGRFSVRLNASAPIVAAMSSYDIQNGRGYGLLGDADGGSVSGAVANISTGNGVDSSLSIYNSTNTTATVTLTFSYTQAALPDLVRVVSLNANSRRHFSLADLGLVSGQPAGIRYTSSMPVTLTAIEYKNGDGDGSNAATSAYTTAVFGDAYVAPDGAGTTYIEQLGIYNPSGTATAVNITFLFADGSVSAPVTVNISGHRFALFEVDQATAILNGPTPAFSIRLDSSAPFVASFTHYDLFLGGGWSTGGAPIGLTNALSTIS